MSVDQVRQDLNAIIDLVEGQQAEQAYAFLLGRWDQVQALAAAALVELNVAGVREFYEAAQQCAQAMNIA